MRSEPVLTLSQTTLAHIGKSFMGRKEEQLMVRNLTENPHLSS